MNEKLAFLHTITKYNFDKLKIQFRKLTFIVVVEHR